jgi:hypothetical protein
LYFVFSSFVFLISSSSSICSTFFSDNQNLSLLLLSYFIIQTFFFFDRLRCAQAFLFLIISFSIILFRSIQILYTKYPKIPHDKHPRRRRIMNNSIIHLPVV